ncbi:MAG TPA: serine hydrolase domain-containing protein [Mycobacteriales bacterium]|nr:serine hydrolase domain-containing protein [Mycobacteriales bacterium]
MPESWAALYKDLLDTLALETGSATPGVAVTILGDGERWSGARNVDPDACFRIASVTKTFVAAAVLRLHEDHRLDIFAPLPPSCEGTDQLAAAGADLTVLTPLHLLAHTSGLPDHSADPDWRAAVLRHPARRWTRGEQLAQALHQSLLGPPGEVFSYSDTGYVILGALIEQATGLPLGQALRAVLGYAELGLSDTWFERGDTAPATPPPRMTQYAGETDVGTLDCSIDLFGGGGLISTTRDLAHFAGQLMRGDVLRHRSSLDIMKHPGTHAGRAEQGLGLFQLDPAGEPLWGHTGFWGTAMAATDDGRWSIAVVVAHAPGMGGLDPTGLPARFRQRRLGAAGDP